VEQEQMLYVIGMGNLPDSDELVGYHYFTNPSGLRVSRASAGGVGWLCAPLVAGPSKESQCASSSGLRARR
jgi:hypothetical protein